jgi:dTDP-glucose pyrophosphorylase
MAGKSLHFSDHEYPYPRPLFEIGQKTIIENVITNLQSVGSSIQFIFVVSSSDCRKFHLDSTLNIITDHKCKLVKVENDTRGAACSALMAISHIERYQPLVIANPDQLFDYCIADLLDQFNDADAGVVTFESVHPRWSYVKHDDHGLVVETAEKRPISRTAIAGFYYFQRGEDFVSSAMSMIRKDSNVDGNFYIAPCLNELILMGKKIRSASVDPDKYHTFYTPHKIKEYEAHMHRMENSNLPTIA